MTCLLYLKRSVHSSANKVNSHFIHLPTKLLHALAIILIDNDYSASSLKSSVLYKNSLQVMPFTLQDLSLNIFLVYWNYYYLLLIIVLLSFLPIIFFYIRAQGTYYYVVGAKCTILNSLFQNKYLFIRFPPPPTFIPFCFYKQKNVQKLVELDK